MQSFEGKNFLIIGGNSGIGKAIVDNLRQEKANIWQASRNPSEVDGVTSVKLDVLSMEDGIQDLPDTLHGLVYCPGSINLKPFQSFKTSDFQKDFEINVLGAIKVVQASLKALKKAKGSSIVFFSTVAAKVGMNFHTSVATSKAALEGLAISLAAEYANSGIRVNLVAPSLTDTPLAESLLSSDEKKENSKSRHPLKKIGAPEEMASAATFLLSPDNLWITGQIIRPDGGLSSIKPL